MSKEKEKRWREEWEEVEVIGKRAQVIGVILLILFVFALLSVFTAIK